MAFCEDTLSQAMPACWPRGRMFQDGVFSRAGTANHGLLAVLMQPAKQCSCRSCLGG